MPKSTQPDVLGTGSIQEPDRRFDMKGTEVIARFLESGLEENDLVEAVYGGLHPVHFGAVLKPHNCLTCIYAEPPAEAAQTKTDPGACHNPIPRKYQAGLSYCSHTRIGEPNGRKFERTSNADDDIIERLLPDCESVREEVEALVSNGACVCDYEPMDDMDLFERLLKCEFLESEVGEYLSELSEDERTPIDPRPTVAANEPEDWRRADMPEKLVALCQAEGIKDPNVIARRVDEIFTGDRRLSPRALGALLPANPGSVISTGGQRDRGKRLRGEKA